MAMDKKYTVFLSSTYDDLREESLIKRHPAIGWVRGDNVMDSAMISRMQTVYEEKHI